MSNFETNYEVKKGVETMQRPTTSEIVIKEFTKIIDSQDVKGLEKYGTTIDEAADKNYNWELMALEEAADLQKYLVKQIIKLKAELHLLKTKSWFPVYQENLKLQQEVERLKIIEQAYEGMKTAL